MAPDDLIRTAALLGLFALFAGAWGVLYCYGRLQQSGRLIWAGWMCYGGQLLATTAIITVTPLAMPWKALITVSLIACARIPPVAWRHLRQMHQIAEREP